MKKAILFFAMIALIFSCSLQRPRAIHPPAITKEKITYRGDRTYNSPFGFSIQLPSQWLILSKKEIKNNPDLFESLFEAEIFKNFNKPLRERIKSMLVSGNTEYYFNQKEYPDNALINVLKQIGRIPQTASEANNFCKDIPRMSLKFFGKSIAVYKCDLRKIAGLNAFYLEQDGLEDGTRQMLYQIQKSSSVTINLTATCNNQSLKTL